MLGRLQDAVQTPLRRRGLAKEKPEAYKNIDAVIETSHQAGVARKIARLVPRDVVKG